MARYVIRWVDVALDQYLSLTAEQQSLIDRRLGGLADGPDGDGCRYDADSDTWIATDEQAAGLIVYTFRTDGPRIIVLRLVYY